MKIIVDCVKKPYDGTFANTTFEVPDGAHIFQHEVLHDRRGVEAARVVWFSYEVDE